MRYFRSPLASLHCAQRNNHITFRKARACKGRETGTVPTDVLPGETARGWEQMLCEKESQASPVAPGWGAGPSQHPAGPSASKSGNSMLFLSTHTFPSLPPASLNTHIKSCVKSEQGALYCRAHSHTLAPMPGIQKSPSPEKHSFPSPGHLHKSSTSLGAVLTVSKHVSSPISLQSILLFPFHTLPSLPFRLVNSSSWVLDPEHLNQR